MIFQQRGSCEPALTEPEKTQAKSSRGCSRRGSCTAILLPRPPYDPFRPTPSPQACIPDTTYQSRSRQTEVSCVLQPGSRVSIESNGRGRAETDGIRPYAHVRDDPVRLLPLALTTTAVWLALQPRAQRRRGSRSIWHSQQDGVVFSLDIARSRTVRTAKTCTPRAQSITRG